MSDDVDINAKRRKAFGSSYQSVVKEIPQSEQSIQYMAAQRILYAKKASDSLIEFARFTSPDPQNPSDASLTKYQAKRHHQALAAALEEVAKGNIKRLIVSMPPRHGKTELCCVRFIPWFLAKFPGKHTIYATYNDNLATDKGGEVMSIMAEPSFKQVFPKCQLSKGGKSQSRIKTTNKNSAFFVGRGGAITGRGGDLIVVDDLFKNDEEADSPTMREKIWKWFVGTVMNRFMTDEGAIILVMTRWHEDDVIGRLTDPENPNYSPEIAAGWDVVNIPAIAEEGDLLGRPVGEALWPERFGLKYLSEQRALSSRRFSCLFQGNPSPEEGIEFLRKWVRYYNPSSLRRDGLKIYAACDLSVGTKEQLKAGRVADRSCHIVVGIDDNDDIYILDANINRDRSDKNVENMIDIMLTYKPISYFTYQDQITGSIGPFLYKRMNERKAYTHVSEHSSVGSKIQKSQSFKGRMSMGKVFFPRGKYWANDIIDELVRFPGGKNDDCVDTCSLIGQALDLQQTGSSEDIDDDKTPQVGTLAWIKFSDNLERAARAEAEADGF